MSKRKEDKRDTDANGVSLNNVSSDATKALLGADADEELRMEDRLIEQKDHTIDGKAKRVTYDDLRASQRIPDEKISADEETGLIALPTEERRDS